MASDLHLKKLLWTSNFQICPVCQGLAIKEKKTVEGCRPNGDAYGFVIFSCESTGCTWSSIFRYDDAADVYYYETTDWSKS
jgi:hypothetical protein